MLKIMNGNYYIDNCDCISELYNEIKKENNNDAYLTYYKYIKEYINNKYNINFKLFLDSNNVLSRISSDLFIIDNKHKICKLTINNINSFKTTILVLDDLFFDDLINKKIIYLKNIALNNIYHISLEKSDFNLLLFYDNYHSLDLYSFIDSVNAKSTGVFKHQLENYLLNKFFNVSGYIMLDFDDVSTLSIFNDKDILLYKYLYKSKKIFDKYTYENNKIIKFENNDLFFSVQWNNDGLIIFEENHIFSFINNNLSIDHSFILHKYNDVYKIKDIYIENNGINDYNYIIESIKSNISLINIILQKLFLSKIKIDINDILTDFYNKQDDYLINKILSDKIDIWYYISNYEKDYFDTIAIYENDVLLGYLQANRIPFSKYQKSICKYIIKDNGDIINQDIAVNYLKHRNTFGILN